MKLASIMKHDLSYDPERKKQFHTTIACPIVHATPEELRGVIAALGRRGKRLGGEGQ